MSRLIVEPQRIVGSVLLLNSEETRYIRRVLRLQPGAPIRVLDGQGREYQGHLGDSRRGPASVVLSGEPSKAMPPARCQITVAQAIPKSQKLELVIQKSTELGVAAFVPLTTERTVVTLSLGRRVESKVSRWRKVAHEAARQCGRGDIPTVHEPMELEEFADDWEGPLGLVLYEDADAQFGITQLGRKLAERPPPARCAIVVGPEGGLSLDEVRRMRARGFHPVSLGQRILRTETAALVVLSILQYHWGELG